MPANIPHVGLRHLPATPRRSRMRAARTGPPQKRPGGTIGHYCSSAGSNGEGPCRFKLRIRTRNDISAPPDWYAATLNLILVLLLPSGTWFNSKLGLVTLTR